MEMRKGVFYAVGVGPGDAELMTLKALRVLTQCPVLALPRSGAGTAALDIVRKALDISDKELLLLPTPMTREKEKLAQAHEAGVALVISALESGRDVAMPNLGDVSIYASASYILERVAQAGFETVMVPGVPSFCAAAAKLNTSLTSPDKPIVIIPGSAEDMEGLLKQKGTKVLMKSGRQIGDTVNTLEALGLIDCAAAVENCGMQNERVITDVRELLEGSGYFTTIIVKETD